MSVMEQNQTITQTLTATPRTAGLAVRLALAELKRRQIDPAPLLSQAGVPAAVLADRLGTGIGISVISQINFLELVSRATKDDWIGITLARNFDLRELGMLYYAAASSHQLGDAVKRLERYVRVGNEALIVRLSKGKLCSVFISYTGVPRHLDRHQMEFLTFAFVRLCRDLVGRTISPVSVKFAHHRSGELVEVQRLFGCLPEYGASVDEVCFDGEVFEMPLVNADPFLNELMVRNCEEAIAKRPSNISPFRTLVENTIAPLLPHADAQAKTVARQLGLSERTFARRLATEGLSFGEILDDFRREQAERYLEDQRLPVSKIAWLLGFQQPSSFSHAWRRWTGKNPSEFRKARAHALAK